MKRISRVIAAVLAALLMLSAFAGCHQKDAVVATYSANGKTYKLTSGQYAYAMILAESEGRNLVTEKLTDEEKKSGKEIDFYKKTIEKKKFADWVTDRAEELCREYFTIASSFDKYKLELSDSDKEGKDSYLSYQWQMSGYMYICEPNGVSYESFASFQEVFSYQRNALLKHIYGEKGPKTVSKDDLTKSLTDNFVLANLLEIDSSRLVKEDTDEAKEAAKKEAQDKLNGYVDRLKLGETFKTIYDEYAAEQKAKEEADKKPTSSTTASSEATSSESASSETGSANTSSTTSSEGKEELKPLDELASLLGSEKSSTASEIFKDVAKCENGVPTVIEKEGVYILVIRQDITADPYYTENYTNEALIILKGDEFDSNLAKDAKKVEIEFNNYERNHIKPQKIDYTLYQQYVASMYGNYSY